MKKFPIYRQMDNVDCGPTCLKMIAKFHGRVYDIEYLRQRSFLTNEGVLISGIAEAAEDIGMHTFAAAIDFDTLKSEAPLPCIVHWRQMHFVVVYEITKKKVVVGDPNFGLIKYSHEEFLNGWLRDNEESNSGVVLLIEPTEEFHNKDSQKEKSDIGLKYLVPYFKKYTSYIKQLIIGLIVSSVILLIFPFLTQAIYSYPRN